MMVINIIALYHYDVCKCSVFALHILRFHNIIHVLTGLSPAKKADKECSSCF